MNLNLFTIPLSSIAEPEPHHLVGAGAVTLCGGSGSDNGIQHGQEWKNSTKCNSLQPIQFIISAI
jgi:hypothetical protein